MPEGDAIALPSSHMMQMMYYRGEPSNKYDSCYATIFRNNSSEDGILIDCIKLIEFEEVIKQFPQVQFALKDGLRVHFEAIAQHYGLNTSKVDFTLELTIAAFFATHTYSGAHQDFEMVTSGIG